MKRVNILCLLMALMMLCVVGCQKRASNPVNEGDYVLYFLESGSDRITTINYEAKYDPNTKMLVQELYDALGNVPNENYTSVIPANVFFTDVSLSSAGVLHLGFSESYSEMDNVTEIMFRAAVVKTLVQIPDVEYVSFYIGDQPLVGKDGRSYGLMNAGTFVSDVDDAMENLNWLELTLYYSDGEGEHLIGEKTKLAYSSSISIEQVVIEQLAKGPTTTSCRQAVPSSTGVVSVSTKDGICYVNFDNNFTNNIEDCTAEVSLYSIINSLCELSNVKKVMFMVNGNSDVVFRELYPFSEAYERNLDLIEAKVDAETQTQEE